MQVDRHHKNNDPRNQEIRNDQLVNRNQLTRRSIKFLALTTMLFSVGIAQAANSTYSAMYFHSQVRDASNCEMRVENDAIVFPEKITNPAATCQDAFGWKQVLEAVQAEFWLQWANDETVWVMNPKPLCTDAQPNDCCFVDSDATPQVGYRDAYGNIVKPLDIGGPGEYCPYIPGDYGGADETTFKGGKPQTSHNTTFLRNMDPGRIARQREAEVVYRNDPFVIYTTENDLYSKAGLAKLFTEVAGEAAHSIPYRPTGQGVSYPTDAVMFKVDWIPEATMVSLGYVSDHDGDPSTPPQNPEHPYITMLMNVKTDNGSTYKESLYYLAAITGASKALPNWHWYAFEHVGNPGRCDFIGCNDSYGYKTTVTIDSPIQPGCTIPVTQTFDSNFITPNTEADQLDNNSDLFKLGQIYPSGNITDGLDALYSGLGIASGSQPVDPKMPKITDPGWRSYRLKGTQTQFYNRDGYPTIVGASITEGGFVNTSSCMSCHVQASVNKDGGLGVPGVGATGRLNLFGIGTTTNGAPHNSDFYDRGTTNQRAVQTDFVWGILFAK